MSLLLTGAGIRVAATIDPLDYLPAGLSALLAVPAGAAASPVVQLDDLTGNDNPGTQPTSGKRGVVAPANLGLLRAARLDGTDDNYFWDSMVPVFESDGSWTFGLIYRLNTLYTTQNQVGLMVANKTAGSANPTHDLFLSHNQDWECGTDRRDAAGTLVSVAGFGDINGLVRAMVVTYDGGTGTMNWYEEGVLTKTADMSAAIDMGTVDSVTLCSHLRVNADDDYMDADVSLIAAYPSALTGSDLTALNAGLMELAGLTGPHAPAAGTSYMAMDLAADAGVYHDIDRQSAATNGQTLGCWQDAGPLAYHGYRYDPYQATSVPPPTWVADYGDGLPEVLFDGTQLIGLGTVGRHLNGEFTVVLVARCPSATAGGHFAFGAGNYGTNSYALLTLRDDGDTDRFVASSGNSFTYSGSQDADYHLYAFGRQANGNSYFSRDGVVGTPVALGGWPTDLRHVTLGALVRGANPAGTGFTPLGVRAVKVYAAAPAALDLATITAAVKAKWGTP